MSLQHEDTSSATSWIFFSDSRGRSSWRSAGEAHDDAAAESSAEEEAHDDAATASSAEEDSPTEVAAESSACETAYEEQVKLTCW